MKEVRSVDTREGQESSRESAKVSFIGTAATLYEVRIRIGEHPIVLRCENLVDETLCHLS